MEIIPWSPKHGELSIRFGDRCILDFRQGKLSGMSYFGSAIPRETLEEKALVVIERAINRTLKLGR